MKINIAPKLFLGFLVIICLNAFFVLVVSRLSSLNTIANILKKQNEVRNALLQARNQHADRKRSRFIYNNIGNEESVKNFTKTGAEITEKIDSVLQILNVILELDSMGSEKKTYSPTLIALVEKVEKDIKRNNEVYNHAFQEYVKHKESRSNLKLRLLNTIIDTADSSLKTGLDYVDPLIEDLTRSRIKEIENRVSNVGNLTQFILLVISVFSISFAFIFSRIITNSLRRLKEAASVIATGDFDFNPRGYPQDEIGDLANAFFDMAHDLKKTQEELIKKRRLAAIGQIVASVNHEINNPLMIISGNAQFLEMTIDNGVTHDVKERIHAILEETERISHVTKKLRDIKNPVVEDYTSSGEKMINLDKSSH